MSVHFWPRVHILVPKILLYASPRLRLSTDAIPTIHVPAPGECNTTAKSPKSGAFEKRERKRILSDMLEPEQIPLPVEATAAETSLSTPAHHNKRNYLMAQNSLF